LEIPRRRSLGKTTRVEQPSNHSSNHGAVLTKAA
jgi:hypothetical protein